jgi:twinkle protein
MVSKNLFYELGIEIKNNATQQKCKCPNCKTLGKENYNDTCLSVNLSDGLYNCHKCGWNGCVIKGETKRYEKPIKTNFTKLTLDALTLFTSRGITQDVVNANKIAQEGDWVIFPYLRNGELINFKKRNTKTKDFRQSVNAEAIMYNYDRIKNSKEIIITEGEFDCMAFEVAGYTNVTTVNQGAPNETDKNIDKKLECITNCYEVFEQADVIYIAVDKDNNGLRLENELIRRLGSEKCKVISFPIGCKDANDVLLKDGKETLIECFRTAKQVKIEGIYTLDDVRDSMIKTFNDGKRRGEPTHWFELNENYTHRLGEVTLWTGYMNEGKSTFLKQLLLAKACFDNWTIGVFSPEDFPADEFYDDLIHMYVGKSTDRYDYHVMERAEYNDAIEIIKKKFFYVYPEKDFTWESVEKKMIYLIRKHGVKAIILDPYNQFDHNQGTQREDLYISKFMAKLKHFAIINDVAVHLVAHQVTPMYIAGQDYPQPNAYKIKGGGTFADKADNVCFIWRKYRCTDPKNPLVVFGADKIKKQRLVGKLGQKDFVYDYLTNRYYLNNKNPFHNIAMKQSNVFETPEQLEPNNDFLNDIKINDIENPF